MEPIVVNAKAGPDQWAAAFRYLFMAGAGAATAFGFTKLAGELSGLLVIAGPLGGLAALLWGQWKTRRQALKMTIMAKALPDSVAQVKGE